MNECKSLGGGGGGGGSSGWGAETGDGTGDAVSALPPPHVLVPRRAVAHKGLAWLPCGPTTAASSIPGKAVAFT